LERLHILGSRRPTGSTRTELLPWRLGTLRLLLRILRVHLAQRRQYPLLDVLAVDHAAAVRRIEFVGEPLAARGPRCLVGRGIVGDVASDVGELSAHLLLSKPLLP